jgi:uncharacterized protein
MKNAAELVDWFRDKGGVLVAFSGGVDSAVVAKAALSALGDNAVAATADSATLAKEELQHAKKLAGEIGIEHVVFEEDEFDNPRFIENPPDRCYHCRSTLIAGLKEIAAQRKIEVIVDGANADDSKQHRPGMRAMRENGVRSPLLELGFGKNMVRSIARELGLSVAEKPAMACLASRIPYGEVITMEKLRKIEEAEAYLKELGFKQLRVRHHRGIARIEVGEEEIPNVMENRRRIAEKLRRLGFSYVTLDLEGYRSGSMDEVL